MLRMLRSAVFMVPMNSRLLGRSKSAGVLQVDGLVAVFQQVHQLAEDSRQVGPVHLVDDEHIWPIVGRPLASTMDFTTPGRTSKIGAPLSAPGRSPSTNSS